MPDLVVDSSVAVKWLLNEADSLAARSVLNEVIARGDQIVLLDIAVAEVGNAIWKRNHRGKMPRPDAERLVNTLARLPIEVEPSSRVLERGFEIALDYDRSMYDALFVALAVDLKLPGLTADEPLHGAVRAKYPGIVLLRDWP